MKQLFVDTSAWDALADKADKDHLSAIRFRNEITGRRKLVTSNYLRKERDSWN
ncbi:MAG: Ribonuclease VapC [Thermodesulfobacteriota bacterium]|nr:Ribonuclease VapC [Thermodesulfobacteriota bacterium]